MGAIREGGGVDITSTELEIRACMHGVGAGILEKILNVDSGYRGGCVKDGEGYAYRFKDYREKRVITVLGGIRIRRAYYYDEKRGKGYAPRDHDLGVAGRSFSPGVRRMMSRVGAYRPFGAGREDLEILSGLSVTAKEVERVCNQVGAFIEEAGHEVESKGTGTLEGSSIPIGYILMDGTGIPMVKSATQGRKGKGVNQEAKTREVKVGCVFTQTKLDEEGRPERDEGSTSYVGAIEPASEFGWRLYREVVRRGVDRAKQVCVIGDGASWIWNLTEEHFPGAIQIVDIYHAREHLWEAGRLYFGEAKGTLRSWVERLMKYLDAGDVEKVIRDIRAKIPTAGEHAKALEQEANYFWKNRRRMRYHRFRNMGLFVGSGVVEAGCRTVIGQRLKQSGMHWTVRGANHIIALRCSLFSGRWETLWEKQAA